MAIALEIYEALRSVGVEDAKAKSAAEKFDQELDARFQRELRILATREDLAKDTGLLREDLAKDTGLLREDLARETGLLREDLAGVRGEMAGIRGQMATREDLARETGNLRAELLGEMGKLESRLIRWNVGTMIAVAGLTLAIVKLIG